MAKAAGVPVVPVSIGNLFRFNPPFRYLKKIKFIQKIVLQMIIVIFIYI